MPTVSGPPQAFAPGQEDIPPEENIADEAIPKPKRHKRDLKPWSADMFAHLTGEDIPEVIDHTMAFDA